MSEFLFKNKQTNKPINTCSALGRQRQENSYFVSLDSFMSSGQPRVHSKNKTRITQVDRLKKQTNEHKTKNNSGKNEEREKQKQEGTCDKTDLSEALCSDLCPPPRSPLQILTTQPSTYEPVGDILGRNCSRRSREVLMVCSADLTVQLLIIKSYWRTTISSSRSMGSAAVSRALNCWNRALLTWLFSCTM